MKLARFLTTCASLAIFTQLIGCDSEPTAVGSDELAPQFHHRPGHGERGGTNNEFAVTIGFRNALDDRITSDKEGPYDEGGRIRSDGLLVWNLDRSFIIHFTDLVVEGSGEGLSGFEPSRVGTLRVLVHDASAELSGHLLGMAIGAEHPAILKTRVDTDDTRLAGPPRNRLTYQLRFQNPLDTDPDADINKTITDPNRSSFLTIQRADKDEWTIEADSDALGIGISQRGSGGNTEYGDEGSFELPFQMTVTCEACPAPPDS